jgi:hypothetical protein
MIDNIEIICENYTPTERIEWTNSDLNDNKPKTLFLAKLYNRTRKKENYFMSLFLLADEEKDKFTLLVRGNLNNWYSQKIIGRDLTYQEYKDSIKLLLYEIEVSENKLMKAKVKNIDVRINIDLTSVFGSRKN